MTAAERRGAAWGAHRAFLANVTGWQFGPASPDSIQGVVFWTVQTIRTHEGPFPMSVLSIIREPADLSR